MRKDKARDIARGVLPSTARKGARDNKRNIHKKHRSHQRQANHDIARHLAVESDKGTVVHDPDLFDDFEDLDTFDGYTAATVVPSLGWGGWDEIIYSRRAADKLGPLISWAEATEKNKMVGWDDADKIAYFKAVLPDSLQGRHALGHVKTALRLEDDEFRRFFRPLPAPLTRNDIYNGLTKILANSKARSALREFLYENVPVAAHHTVSNNKVRSYEPAVDENGNYRYHTIEGRSYRITVDVFIPQVVSATCDDCSFLRNNPLATPEAIKRFVDLLWDNRLRYGRYFRPKNRSNSEHDYFRVIIGHVIGER